MTSPYAERATLEIIAWAIPLVLAALYLWQKKIWTKTANWWRSVVARKRGTEAMVAAFPTFAAYMADSRNREDTRDARDIRFTAEFAGLREHLEQQDLKLDSIVAHQWGAMKLDPQARFICDAKGSNTDVNTAYGNLLRVGEASLKAFGYKNYVDPSHLGKYVTTVMQAFAEHRRFEGTVVMVRGDGTRFLAHVRLEPYPEDPSQGLASHWFGAVTRVEELDK